MSDVALDISDLVVRLGKSPQGERVIDAVSLHVRERETLCLVGESGSGKSVTALTVMGLLQKGSLVPSGGSVKLVGEQLLGAGISPETPTWGNIMAEGRAYFQIKPSLIFWPGLLLSIAILSVNLIGDAARDALDPRMKEREGGK